MQTVESTRGATWRKWDLHVHTPASLQQQYGPNDDAGIWERFIQELEGLPPEFSVIGINDYWFLDGYKKVLEFKSHGRLANLNALFPVLELRLDQFAGTTGKLQRANLHVIFDPDVGAEVITHQFVAALSSKFQLSPAANADAISWSGVPDRESLEDLGRKIKQSVPPDLVTGYESDLKEGFNNLTISLAAVEQILNNSYFVNHSLLALGKTEWADIAWQDGSIATKKNLINSVSLLFTAFADPADWSVQQAKLAAQGVNSALIDCSDAHTWSSNTENKDRIGNCSAWIRATPTFSGLVHALTEYNSRIFVGFQPADLQRASIRPERIIDRLVLAPSVGTKGTLFSYELLLNPGLVAIIGNKGQGKSALLDCLARGGNSSRDSEFAFLTSRRFLDPRNSDQNYTVTLTWLTGQTRKASLNEAHDPTSAEVVEYVPQALFERICNSDPLSVERGSFESEVKRIVFRHVPRSERAGVSTFDGLVNVRTRSIEVRADAERRTIRENVQRYLHVRDLQQSLTIATLSTKLRTSTAELAAAEAQLTAAEVALSELSDSSVGSNRSAKINEDRQLLEEFEERTERAQAQDEAELIRLAAVDDKLAWVNAAMAEADPLEAQAQILNAQFEKILGQRGLPFVVLVVQREELTVAIQSLRDQRIPLDSAMNARRAEQEALAVQRQTIAERLSLVDANREAARRSVEQLRERIRNINGAADAPDTVLGLTAQIARADSLPAELADAMEAILRGSLRMHELLMQRLRVVREAYEPAERYIANSDVARQAGVSFSADLMVSDRWEALSKDLDGRRSPDLQDSFVSWPSTMDAQDEGQTVDIVQSVVDRLGHERGNLQGAPRDAALALRSQANLEDFIMEVCGLSWLQERISISGNGLPLDQLSPGQRGLVLLLFYLVVDLSSLPLLLDQPEENLDNDAVRTFLVPALKVARARRQVIVVTHNANLAIVGDADQIVHCSFTDAAFAVVGGSLADQQTGEASINVLEGARGAFENRRGKYERVVAH